MDKAKIITIIAVILLSVSCNEKSETSDSLVGTWKATGVDWGREVNGERIITSHESVEDFYGCSEFYITFKSDGSASEQYVGLEPDAYMGASLKKWRIEKNTLILTYEVYIGDRPGHEEGDIEEDESEYPLILTGNKLQLQNSSIGSDENGEFLEIYIENFERL